MNYLPKKRSQGFESSRGLVGWVEVRNPTKAFELFRVRMLYISYGSVCEPETQILLAEGLDLIEKGVSGKLKKDITESERMLKALIKSLKNKPLNP